MSASGGRSKSTPIVILRSSARLIRASMLLDFSQIPMEFSGIPHYVYIYIM